MAWGTGEALPRWEAGVHDCDKRERQRDAACGMGLVESHAGHVTSWLKASDLCAHCVMPALMVPPLPQAATCSARCSCPPATAAGAASLAGGAAAAAWRCTWPGRWPTCTRWASCTWTVRIHL